MVIQAADASDLPAVRRLLESQHLPLDGIDEHVSAMVVAKKESEVVGAAAVELYADGALFAALSIAKDRGTRTAFLLTTTAERFFRSLVSSRSVATRFQCRCRRRSNSSQPASFNESGSRSWTIGSIARRAALPREVAPS